MFSRRGIVIALALFGAVCAAKGLPDTVQYAAPGATIAMKNDTTVVFKLTHANAEEMKVRIKVTNMSSQLMLLDRDGILVRLADGKTLKRLGMKRDYMEIAPGKSEDVSVNFGDKGRDMRVDKATIVMGGVSFANDPKPRVVGEIPLTQNGEAD